MFTQEQIKKGLSERIDRYFAGYPDQDLNQNVIKKTKEVNYKNKTEEQRRSELYGLYLASCSISDYDRMDPDDAILGWKDLPQGWDKDFNDTYSPKNMTFSDWQISYWVEPSSLLNLTASLMHDKSKSLDVDEDIANRRKYNACANVKEQMVERLIKEGVNTQAAMSEGYERLCFLYVNALDGKNNIDLKDSLVLDAINYYQNAINYITKCENQHSPYKNIGNCLQIIKDYEHKPENKRSSSDEAMYDAARASMKSRMKDLGLGNLRFENPLDELYAKRWIENEKRERRAKGLLKNLTKEILKDSNKNEKQGQGHDNI